MLGVCGLGPSELLLDPFRVVCGSSVRNFKSLFQIASATMTSNTIEQGRVAADALRSAMQGEVLTADDAGYETAREQWNGAPPHRPAVIARCLGEDDVMAALRVAREVAIPVSVRGAGHDWAGRSLRHEGLVIDLSAMRQVSVSPTDGIATAEGGATAGDLVKCARVYGLAPATGTVGAVGMAGLTLGGGYGPLCGRFGLAADNLAGADVLLADGRLVTADPTENPDLYWALRGGGGCSGIVTHARYRVHPLVTVRAGLIAFGMYEAEAVFEGYGKLLAQAPDELTVMAGCLHSPNGEPLMFLFPVWSGQPGDGDDIIAALAGLGTPLMSDVREMGYEDALRMFDAQVVDGRHYHLRTRWLADLSPAAADALVEAGATAGSPLSAIAVHHFHGAASRVPVASTAFGLREDHLMVEILAAWDPGDPGGAHYREWADRLSEILAPHALPGGYPNILGPDEGARVRLAYGPNAQRLATVRAEYDPDGVFSDAIGSF
jgi:FAD/FMN-containing dehydrogenase